MSVNQLPQRPSLEHLRNEARDLRRGIRQGDSTAVAALRRHHPNPPAPADARLADAQLAVARSYGFVSWPALVRGVDAVLRHTRSPHHREPGGLQTREERADELLRLACLTYGGDSPQRIAAAEELLATEPELSGVSIHAAAACGDIEAAERLLGENRVLADREGGPHAWAPLLYLCLSRLAPGPGREPVAVARLLLDSGADPNAGYLWGGSAPPFTALTGVFGGGEGGTNQPPHRDETALATLLLERGADPNDGQTLYNRHFTPSNSHLELLFSFGLGQGDGGPWRHVLGSESPATMLEDQLLFATANGFTERVALLLAHGVNPTGRGTGHPALRGRRPMDIAMEDHHAEIVALLTAAGVPRPALDPVDELLAALLSGDRGAVRRLVATEAALLDEARRRAPARIIRAAELGRAEAVVLLAENGFDLNALARTTALHAAAWNGDRPMVELLLSLGADPTIRDREHGGTPAGWAEYNGHTELASFLAARE